ncbi:MAG TPA: hypothetical protein VGH19_06490 [Verrucomicrobiae bacterium]
MKKTIEQKVQVGPRTSLVETEMVCTGCVHLKIRLERPARKDEEAEWNYECLHPDVEVAWMGISAEPPSCPGRCPERKSNKKATP